MPSVSIYPLNCKIRKSPYAFNRSSTSISRKESIEKQKGVLPISSVEKKLVEEVSKNEVLLVIGETGSGKTTQLPQFLYSGGFCKDGKVIGITQPRRVAAVTVASRVAEELRVKLGKEVGYSIRFEDCTSSATRIKYMTDGMLLREALLDPLLSKYSVIIVDEAHERTIHTDVLLGLLKAVLRRRMPVAQIDGRQEDPAKQKLQTKSKANEMLLKFENHIVEKARDAKLEQSTYSEIRSLPLKLIIMSATLEYEEFCHFFGAKAVYVQGRRYPVDILYTYTPEPDYLDAVLITVFQVHLEEESGDILVFLTGQEEIESMERLLHERASQLPQGAAKFVVTPIFAALPVEQQMKVFKPAPVGSRKVILATNIAETSITVPGIRYVIDPGLVKARAYNPRIGVDSLVIVPVSKAQALQRSGRAGRDGPGKCFRLYTEDTFEKLENSTIPEIKRCNLASVVLQLKALGIDDILGFDFLDRPSKISVVKALEQLHILGALTDEGKLSDPLGLQMARFPLEPIYAKSILISSSFNCSEEMLAVVSLLSVESIFYSPKDKLSEANISKQRFTSLKGDHVTLVNVLRAYRNEAENSRKCLESSRDLDKNVDREMWKWCRENFINGRSLRRVFDIYRQLKSYSESMGLQILSCGDDTSALQRCLTAAFFQNAACKHPDGSYRALATGENVFIHPSSVLFDKKPNGVIFNELVYTSRQYIRNITQIELSWLTELAPQYYSSKNIRGAMLHK